MPYINVVYYLVTCLPPTERLLAGFKVSCEVPPCADLLVERGRKNTFPVQSVPVILCAVLQHINFTSSAFTSFLNRKYTNGFIAELAKSITRETCCIRRLTRHTWMGPIRVENHISDTLMVRKEVMDTCCS